MPPPPDSPPHEIFEAVPYQAAFEFYWAVAVAVVLTIGVAGMWYWWRCRQSHEPIAVLKSSRQVLSDIKGQVQRQQLGAAYDLAAEQTFMALLSMSMRTGLQEVCDKSLLHATFGELDSFLADLELFAPEQTAAIMDFFAAYQRLCYGGAQIGVVQLEAYQEQVLGWLDVLMEKVS